MMMLQIKDLEAFHPMEYNTIWFMLTKQELKKDVGKKIIRFLERLEKLGVEYEVVKQSIPPCIFGSEYEKVCRKFKIKDFHKLKICLNCTFFTKNICGGIDDMHQEDYADQLKIVSYEYDQNNMSDGNSPLSFHDLINLVKWLRGSSEINILNGLLDRMFEHRAKNSKEIFWEGISAKFCDYDFLYHYIELKTMLNARQEVKNNVKLKQLLIRTYDKFKQKYAEKKMLEPGDNRWTKLLIMMHWLDLFSKEETLFWIKKYSEYRFDRSKPVLPQAWNRVWVFTRGLGIRNINDLKRFGYVDFEKSKKIICSYIPELKDLEEQNVFHESKPTMLYKYVAVRTFCNKPVFTEIKELFP